MCRTYICDEQPKEPARANVIAGRREWQRSEGGKGGRRDDPWTQSQMPMLAITRKAIDSTGWPPKAAGATATRSGISG